ncbi:MAG: hypothetical protein DI598_10390 [Pseudopedobacter saltans]|uniref:Uncharacterized protein n=1 Tax=Pseudopedobacter saltans TaxID=151895 RepID=A0A2W5EXX1_9SPHI|nr:MAG: hypothetical protein DI598_10390 [Pseudopedobacter saltans]
MFEKLLGQIKEPALQLTQQDSNIPTDKKEVAANDAISSISEEIDRMMDGGDFSSLSGIKDNENLPNNETIQNVITSFTQKLKSNSGLSADDADKSSKNLIPTLFVQMKEKFSSEKMDLKSLMGNLNLSEIMKLMANMGKLKDALGK